MANSVFENMLSQYLPKTQIISTFGTICVIIFHIPIRKTTGYNLFKWYQPSPNPQRIWQLLLTERRWADRDYTTHGCGAYQQKIYATPFSFNIASQKVLQKAGFEREAILKKAAIKNGEIVDEHYYSFFRSLTAPKRA